MAVRVGLQNIERIDLDANRQTLFQKCRNWFNNHRDLIDLITNIAHLSFLILLLSPGLFEIGSLASKIHLILLLANSLVLFVSWLASTIFRN